MTTGSLVLSEQWERTREGNRRGQPRLQHQQLTKTGRRPLAVGLLRALLPTASPVPVMPKCLRPGASGKCAGDVSEGESKTK